LSATKCLSHKQFIRHGCGFAEYLFSNKSNNGLQAFAEHPACAGAALRAVSGASGLTGSI